MHSKTPWALALLAVAACAGSGPPAYGTRAPAYGQPEALPPLLPHEQHAVDAIRTRLVENGVAGLTLDARLGRAAMALNQKRADARGREACDVSAAAEEAALDWAGVYERPTCQRCFWTRKNPPVIPDEILHGMAECLTGPGQVVLGINSLLDDGRTFVSITGARRQVVLDPLPRVIPRGETVALGGLIDPSVLPASVLLSRPNEPVVAVPLTPSENHAFRVELAQVPTHVRASVVNAAGELARVHLTAVQREPPSAFADEADDDDVTLKAKSAVLISRLQKLRKDRGLPPFELHGAMTAAAQDEANAAQQLRPWLMTPLPETRTRVLSDAAADWQAFKWAGDSVDDLLAQMEASPLAMWPLTRAGTLKLGLGLSTPPPSAGRTQLALTLVIGSDTGPLQVPLTPAQP